MLEDTLHIHTEEGGNPILKKTWNILYVSYLSINIQKRAISK